MVTEPNTMLPIRRVSEITGVNAVTLRAWQRRFGLLNPHRTPKGHRLYSQKDIDRIFDILNWLKKGVAISKVRPLLEQDAPQVESDLWQPVMADLKKAIVEFDGRSLHKTLDEMTALYPFHLLFEQLLHPLFSVVPQEFADRSDTLLLHNWLWHQLDQRVTAQAHYQKGPFALRVLLVDACHDIPWSGLQAKYELTAANIHWQFINVSSAKGFALLSHRLNIDAVVYIPGQKVTQSERKELLKLKNEIALPCYFYGVFRELWELPKTECIQPGLLSQLPLRT